MGKPKATLLHPTRVPKHPWRNLWGKRGDAKDEVMGTRRLHFRFCFCSAAWLLISIVETQAKSNKNSKHSTSTSKYMRKNPPIEKPRFLTRKKRPVNLELHPLSVWIQFSGPHLSGFSLHYKSEQLAKFSGNVPEIS